MKKILFTLLLISILPGIASAERRMLNSDPTPTKKSGHVMQNSNPSPAKSPKHVMKNTSPNSFSSRNSVSAQQEPSNLQNLGRDYGSK